MIFTATYRLPNGEYEVRKFEFGYDAQDLCNAEADRLAGDGEERVGNVDRVRVEVPE